MKKLILKLIGIVLAAAVFVGAVVVCFVPQNVKFLCGYSDKNDSSLCKTYSAVALSLSPEITSLELQPPEPYRVSPVLDNGKFGFDIEYSQQFEIIRRLKKSNEKDNGLIINDTYSYDIKYQGDLNIDIADSIKTQGFYRNADDALIPPDGDEYGFFYFGFREPLTTQELMQKLEPFISDEDFQNLNSCIMWIAYETSDDDRAPAIGLYGNMTSDIGNLPPEIIGISKLYENLDGKGLESAFVKLLEHLRTYSGNSSTALNSGLFGEAISVDFDERLTYFVNSEVHVIGTVLFTCPEKLSLLDDTFVLLDYHV